MNIVATLSYNKDLRLAQKCSFKGPVGL
jgi:hypothetical protein